MDYHDLIKEGKWQEAADLLRGEVGVSPNDEVRRTLAFCLHVIDHNDEALETVLLIEQPRMTDTILRARIHQQLQQWDEMSVILKVWLKEGETPDIWGLLATAELKGKLTWEVDDATRLLAQSYLRKAIDLPDCQCWWYLMLAETFEDKQADEKEHTLRVAHTKFQDDPSVALELAKQLVSKFSTAQEALGLLEPLTEDKDYCQQARWYVFQALTMLERFTEASKALDRLQCSNSEIRLHIKADLLFKQHRYDDWLLALERLSHNDSNKDAALSAFRKAYICLKNDRTDQAIDHLSRGVEKLVEGNTFVDPYLVLICEDKSHFYYQEFDVITDVCETLLLLNSSHPLGDKVLGLLAICIENALQPYAWREFVELFPDNPSNLLLYGAEKLGHPVYLARDLAWHYVNVDLAISTDYYFQWAVWANSSDSDFLEHLAGLLFSDGSTLALVNIRAKLSATASRYFKSCSNLKTKLEIFESFYAHIWRNILFGAKDHTTVLEVTKVFVEAGNDGYLFDYAYSLKATGQTTEAERMYGRLLEKQPENASVINNLGVIYEERGELDRASDSFNKAAGLDPTDALYHSNIERLKSLVGFRDECKLRAEVMLEGIRQQAFTQGLTEEQLHTLNQLYWESDISTKELQEQYDLKISGSRSLYAFVLPALDGERCPNCTLGLYYKNRTHRNVSQKTCIGCGHTTSGICRCAFCQRKREEQTRIAEETRRKATLEEYERVKREFYTPEYAQKVLANLSETEKRVLGVIQRLSSTNNDASWDDVQREARVRNVNHYIKRFVELKLLVQNPSSELELNSAIDPKYLGDSHIPRGDEAVSAEKLEQFEIAKEYWLISFELKSLSRKDEAAIWNLIGLYDLSWIKEAISITAQKEIWPNYINYTQAILRNWQKDGPPRYLQGMSTPQENSQSQDAQNSEKDRPNRESDFWQPYTVEYIRKLRLFINSKFGVEDFELLCEDMGVSYDALRGGGKEFKVYSLLRWLHQQARIPDLLKHHELTLRRVDSLD